MKLIRIKKETTRKAWGCPRTKNRSNWCYALCVPRGVIGECGRVAAHAIHGRTQRAISSKKIAQEG